VRDALCTANARLLEAENGDEALAVIASERCDLVLLDLLMPHRSGVEVISALHASHPALPVLVVSSMDAQPMVQAALDAGAAGFISKPFHPLEIQHAVGRFLEGRP
jgi:two-component system chemotaxis response regulator CheY